MTRTPVGYSRSTYTWRNETGRPLTDDDARGMLGMQMSVSMCETVLAAGTVTGARVLDDGERMEMTVETGGRSCAACREVYPVEFADRELGAIEDFQARMPTIYNSPIYDNLPRWARVCREAATCMFRRHED